MPQTISGKSKQDPNKKPSLWENRNFTIVLSLLLAVLVWIVVTVFVQPETSTVLEDVPVDFSYDSSKYTGLGLDIVSQPEYSVNLSLTGNGYDLGNLTKEDFVVYPDYSSVKAAGTATLRLKVELLNSDLNGQVQASLDAQTSNVSVVFDAVVERTLPITVQANDLVTAEGYVLNKVTAAPAEVTLSGPESEVSRVESVVAEVQVEDELSESRLVQVPLKLLDENGNELELEYSTLDNTLADVTLAVYQSARLPLVVDFINVPDGFDLASLHYQLSQDTLLVAGPAKQLSTLTELSAGTFDLTSFEMDKDYTLNIALPDGIVSQENTATVKLNFDTQGLETKSLNVSTIRTVNLPSSYTLSVETEQIRNVTLVGPQEDLEALSAANVVAQINADDIQVTTGQQTIAVHILVPSSPKVFAVGNYTVLCTIESK